MQSFETSEYRARLDGVRALMSEAGLDAVLVVNAEDRAESLSGILGGLLERSA